MPLRTITRAQAEKIAERPRERPAHRGGLGHASRQFQRQVTPRSAAGGPAATAFCCSRSIRNIRRRPPRPPATRLSTRSRPCAGSPRIRVVPPYYDDPAYIEALASSTRAGLAALDFEPEVVIASFHGLPQAYFDKGDPYYCHCAKTTRLLREALGWPEQRLLADLSVALRARRVAQALYRRRPSQGWPRAACRRLAVITPGLRRGLHRDAGGDGDPGRARPSASTAASATPPSPASTISAARHRRPFFHRRTRVARLGGWLTCIIARAPLRAPGKCDTVRA